MKLIIGLGNPGSEYARTRHNAGFMLADHLVRNQALFGPRQQFHAETFDGSWHGERIMLLKPQAFMNRSGLTVGEAASFYKCSPEEVLVLVDDLALACGKVRLRASGGAGGHNGLKDIDRALGTQKYPRLRIGIDPKGPGSQVDYVLGRFTDTQSDALQDALNVGIHAISLWLEQGIDKAMTWTNSQ